MGIPIAGKVCMVLWASLSNVNFVKRGLQKQGFCVSYWRKIDKNSDMEEAFLHFVWQYGFFDVKTLKTAAGSTVEILNRGILNRDSGPDFGNARVRIAGNDWAGNVEIHLRSSDWYRHGHERDAAYTNTILHVVYEHDTEVQTAAGDWLPCLELKHLIPGSTYQKYRDFLSTLEVIACVHHRPSELETQTLQMVHRSAVERLIGKSEIFGRVLHSVGNDWECAFYIQLCRYLGFRVNADAMENLARVVPLSLLLRNRDSIFTLEALLFGQAGMLDQKFAEGSYPAKLVKEYRFLAHKYGLQAMNPASWKFLRMRPTNFPTMRIAQLAALLHSRNHLFSRVLEARSSEELSEIFSCEASAFWQEHYHFGAHSPRHSSALGHTAISGLFINVVAPVLFAYGNAIGQETYKEKALDILSALEPEDNRITRQWQEMGFANPSAYHSQGLMGLRELYCERKRCLECAIGQKILRGEMLQ
jgi:hypothetical protein